MSQTPDRTTPPPIIPPQTISVCKPSPETMPNGLTVIPIQTGEQEVIKLELIFHAGTKYQHKPLVARASINQLTEGTHRNTSEQIAEKLDYMGSFVEFSYSRDYASVNVLTISRFFEDTLKLVADMLYHPTYPENELELFKIRGKQQLHVELERVGVLARRNFFRTLFGANHPYGFFANPDHFDELTVNDLSLFHTTHHTSNRSAAIISGKVGSAELDIVRKTLGETRFGEADSTEPAIDLNPKQTRSKTIAYKKEANQTAIRIGKLMVERTHPDYIGLMVLNTVLGGYFGSRLMQNLREEKGYTYGISSGLIPFTRCTVLSIATEVATGVTEAAVEEILTEAERLRTNEIPGKELDLVRNHLIGEVLRSLDGPFALADSYAALYQFNRLDFGYIERIIRTINTITPATLHNLAQRYLNPSEMVISLAGNIPTS